MEARDAELMSSYAPGSRNEVDKSTSRTSQPSKQSRSQELPYTANLIAESVYGGPGYAGTPPSRQRRGKSRNSKKPIPSPVQSRQSNPAPLFLASSFNKQLLETKKAQTAEEMRLRGELERQKRDITLLKSQLKQRDEQLEQMAEKMEKLKAEKAKAVEEQESLSQQSVVSSRPSVSANSKCLSSLSQPRKVRPKSSSDGIAKSYIDWIEYYGAQTPGVIMTLISP